MVAAHAPTDDALIAAWGVGAIIARRQPTSGTLNRTLLAATACGAYVLRAYRHRERLPIEREHALIVYACAQGIPAVAPLPLPGGATLLERAGHFYALFPHAPGRQVARASLSTNEAAAMGRCLATLHIALQRYPAERVAQRVRAVDPACTLREIADTEAQIRARGTLDALDQRALAQLAARRAQLKQNTSTSTPGFAVLAQQVIHGDYQETNLFFDGDRVSAIIDWESAYAAPRAWEITRTIHLALRFDARLSRTFLAAYRALVPLDDAELDVAMRHYGLVRLHDLWLYAAYYGAGNQRVRGLLAEDDGATLGACWDALRAALGATL